MARLTLWCAWVLLLTGCAEMTKLTAQQERTYANFDACDKQIGGIGMRLNYVDPTGGFKWQGSLTGQSRMVDCMRSKGHRFVGDQP